MSTPVPTPATTQDARRPEYSVPIRLPDGRIVVALGGDLKSAVSVMRADRVESSEVFGDLADPAAYRRFVKAVEGFQEKERRTRVTVAHDLHPGYLSTATANRSRFSRIAVQHHHAHIASCLADNGFRSLAIGVACDGTGYGPDGAIWGCEVLVADLGGYERVGHLQYFPLPGGDRAARETWRPALSLVREAYGDDWARQAGPLFERVPARDIGTVDHMLRRNVQCVPTSSLGRLFDGVAFLLGLCAYNREEAEAAIALEQSAKDGRSGRSLPFEIVLLPENEGNRTIIDIRPMIRAIVQRTLEGRPAANLAASFHETVVTALTTLVEIAAERAELNTAAFSGGCFLNQRIREGLTTRLEDRGMTVLQHRQASTTDAGLSLGQAVVAANQVGAKATSPGE